MDYADLECALNVGVTAAFLQEGMQTKQYHEVIRLWGGGHLELVMEVVSLAPYITALGDAGFAVTEGGNGVFEYEVTSPFGSWISETILVTGEFPSKGKATVQAYNMAVKFFSKAKEGDEDEEEFLMKLTKALINVTPDGNFTSS